MKGIVGKKLGMTQEFDEASQRFALTVIQAEPGVVVRVKTPESDGYSAIQVGFLPVDLKKLNRPRAGVYKKHLQTKSGYGLLREFRVEDASAYKVGQEIKVDQFAAGDLVDVFGKTIGKGFAGNIKRHHHSRGPMTHGSKNRREVGSIGSSALPSRVIPGLPMAGHLGAKKRTVQRLKVHKVDLEKNLIFIVGGVPGSRNSIVTVRETAKLKK